MYFKYWICYNIENQTSCETFILPCLCEITILIKMFPHSIKNQKTVSIYLTQEKFAFGSKNQIDFDSVLFTTGKHVLKNRGALHYWQKILNPIGEEISEEPALSSWFACFWLNPISGLKKQQQMRGIRTFLGKTLRHTFSLLPDQLITFSQSLMSSRFIWEAHHLYILSWLKTFCGHRL